MHHRAEVILHPAGRGQEPAVAVGEVRALSGRKYVLPTKNIFLQVPAHRPQVAGVGSLPLPLDYSAAPWLYRPAAISGLPSYLPLPSSLLLNRFGGSEMSILKISTFYLKIYILLVGEGCLTTSKRKDSFRRLCCTNNCY